MQVVQSSKLVLSLNSLFPIQQPPSNEQLIPNIQEHINQAKQQQPTPADKNPIRKRWKQSKPSSHIPQIHTKKRKNEEEAKLKKKLKLTWDFLQQRSCNFTENPRKD